MDKIITLPEPSPLYVGSSGMLGEQRELKSIPDELSERARYRADAESISGFIRYYIGYSREQLRQLVNELAIEWLTKYLTPGSPVDKFIDAEEQAYKAMCFEEVRGWWRVKWNERDSWLVGGNAKSFEKHLLASGNDIEFIRPTMLRLYTSYHRSWLYDDAAYDKQLQCSYSKLWE